ncbi:hydroxymethylglutaryl-CoA reductase, degradative [Virgibacillus necropolis]|uniref:3-hydroxy-3-methylglutaryl coenzyme A reductase n=1 Tax=Virgibacillus necropolis TaxID=163877 RepID=A0A221MA83_9BACI|nr:hydroxymethylglutaryl-CoA reductase, degradative [Virgibacillus necropolis]ASN04566.1 hydroxymethylglutaryl-CoA reductase, degradative [Virgibacillus necropolis]
MNSKTTKFYHQSQRERLSKVKNETSLSEEEANLYNDFGSLGQEIANLLIENSIGVMEIPLGIATNFIVNNKDIFIPMAIEESSVIAAASNGAKLTRPTGGFTVTTTGSRLFSQIQLTGIKDVFGAKMKIHEHEQEILEAAAIQDPTLVNLGGGPESIEVRVFEDMSMIVVHLLVNTLDAMGANAVNSMAEKIAPILEDTTGGKAYLRIISNLADKRLARARCTIKKEVLSDETIDGVISAYRFATVDPYRAATHNKGIMNGISAVVLATGNDTRAVEAGAHAYAARSGQYTSLTTWEKNQEGDLVGTLELPLVVGIIGGATSIHPKAKSNLNMMNIKTANDLVQIIASVGLAQNLTALKALATDGVQKGHMKLHAKNIAHMAGAKGTNIDKIAKQLIEEDNVRIDRAIELLNQGGRN